ncbi:magnesium transporter [sulfur-oxidizing endosymbiont of Gigantopelta aegis]|uniref:magnesium transporter n=1 Tax=sulfur-oxidizing endosymbiont of Gigantopelta aegis TaxID=2794934 RepID=UPI0018DE6ADE|nr:magnesium transporter [sulfur-oxidizing endosymbiont of Gigantopelta aegis]
MPLAQEQQLQEQQLQEQLAPVYVAIDKGQESSVQTLVNSLHPAEIAFLIESLPDEEQRARIWALVAIELKGETLTHLNDYIRLQFIESMPTNELVVTTRTMDHDDMADLLPDMPDVVSRVLLQSMETQHRERLESVLSYAEDSAGGLMNTDTISIRTDISLETVMRYLRFLGQIPDTTDNLIVVNKAGFYQGVLYLSDLLTSDPELSVASVMNTKLRGINASTEQTEVAALFERRDLITAPVVDDLGYLLGRITIDDIVDVIRDEGEHTFMSQAGLSEEDDMFAPVFSSSKRRALWLGVNLLTALLASSVIGMFQVTIEKVVALAVLMPIVASMGGVAGSQTLTLVIRGMALGQLSSKNYQSLMIKELSVSLINGILWALVLAIISGFWFSSQTLAIVIGFAVVINLVVAAFSGVVIPLLLDKAGADPALAGGVFLTTVTDVVGFFAFLGLASIMLV